MHAASHALPGVVVGWIRPPPRLDQRSGLQGRHDLRGGWVRCTAKGGLAREGRQGARGFRWSGAGRVSRGDRRGPRRLPAVEEGQDGAPRMVGKRRCG